VRIPNYPRSARWHTLADGDIAYTGTLKQAKAAGYKLEDRGYRVNLMPASPHGRNRGWSSAFRRRRNPSPGTRIVTTVQDLQKLYRAGLKQAHMTLKVARRAR
jgi:hypothetical protein